MKLYSSEISLAKTRRRIPKVAPLIALTILLTIPLYYPSIEDSYKKLSLDETSNKPPCSVNGEAESQPCNDGDMARKKTRTGRRSKALDEECDLFTGEWVPNPGGPYYTNDTCFGIQEHQNCLKYGRPDTEFLKWKWKPDGCELPEFDPIRFLELVKGKSMAFVGDSVARNHMQSLVCLLSKVAYPRDLSNKSDVQNKRYVYDKHDFNMSMFWSPYLVKTGDLDSDNKKETINLYLDEFDENWTTKVGLYDYIIISAGHWFFRSTYFHLKNSLIGCLYCSDSNVTQLTPHFSYRRAFSTAFRAINDAVNFNGVTFLRTFAPSHYEGGAWDQGGDCVRTTPFRRNESRLEDTNLEMYLIQLEELRVAREAGREQGSGSLGCLMRRRLWC